MSVTRFATGLHLEVSRYVLRPVRYVQIRERRGLKSNRDMARVKGLAACPCFSSSPFIFSSVFA